jgi:hypothetical protein
MERAKVRVMVNFFGRETPVELDSAYLEPGPALFSLISNQTPDITDRAYAPSYQQFQAILWPSVSGIGTG